MTAPASPHPCGSSPTTVSLVVETDAASYKVERIRRDPHVRIAVCDARGRLRGEAVDAEATVLPDSERERVERLLARKYRIDRVIVLPLYRLVLRLRGRGSRARGAAGGDRNRADRQRRFTAESGRFAGKEGVR